jgi:ATP-dependent DNA helicase RecQ
MLAKIFTLRFNELTDSFDDTPLQEFIKNKEILSMRDHFFLRHEVPYLAVIVSYNLQTVEQPKTDGKKERDESWRELLTPEDMPIFNAMRDWRNETSRRQGIAAYIICTNRQLAEIVHKRVSNKNQLSQIEGIGKAKISNYGDDIIAVMSEKIAEINEKI